VVIRRETCHALRSLGPNPLFVTVKRSEVEETADTRTKGGRISDLEPFRHHNCVIELVH
jgi:hypothetical protein